MRIVDLDTQIAEQSFALKAAQAFATHDDMVSFTDGEIEPGALLALRWGLHNRAVLVLRLADSHTPTVYGDLVPAAAEGKPL